MPPTLTVEIAVPSNLRTVPFTPPISAYCPFGFQPTASRSTVDPPDRDRTVVPSKVSAVPLLPTSNAYVPLAFQPTAKRLNVLGPAIVVPGTSLYFTRT